ncbi:MAG: hypothetical protein RI967_1323 [Planctomycetota bacterium]
MATDATGPSADTAIAPDRAGSGVGAPVWNGALDPGEIRRRRTVALAVLVFSGALLAVAWSLSPAREGFGTHRALGLPECSWPVRFGVPCPSCGMTTAFAHAAKGRILASVEAQPMGALLALATGMAFVGSFWTLATGRTVWPVYERVWNARGAWILGILALLAWGYKTATMRGWMG